MKWPTWASRLFIVFVPLIVVLSGFNQFIVVLALAGGCFIALQYLLILAVGRRALALSSFQKILLDIVMAVFVVVIVYEAYGFVVK